MMKEKLCYIGYDIEMEQRLALETTVLVEPYTVSSSLLHDACLFNTNKCIQNALRCIAARWSGHQSRR